MISVMRTPTEVGIYGLSYKVLENIIMLWGLFMASVFPLLSKYYGNSDFSKYRDLLSKTFVLLAGMSVAVIAGGYMFSPLIMRILGGSKFFSSIAPFRILLWSIPFLFLNNVYYNVILSFGKTKYLIPPLVITLIINISFNLYAIPRFGYIGASYTTVITELLTAIIYLLVLITKFRSEITQLVGKS
jgi:O-antigen/teichoic acid export membrane protein